MKNKEEKKYIIKYKFGTFTASRRWNYSITITNTGTWSTAKSNNENILKMTLIEAKKNVIKIKEIRKKNKPEIKEIQIINIETNKIVDMSQKKYTKFTRFEIMDI